MRPRTLCTTVIALLLVAGLSTDVLAQPDPEPLEIRRKLGQTGMQFLSVSVDARAAALGNAFTAHGGSSVSQFYNPAGLAEMDGFSHVSLGQVQWIANTEYNYGSVAFRPFDGIYGAVGLSVVSVSYGNFIGTRRAENESGYVDTDNFTPSSFAAGIGYARSLTDKFSVGANVKYVRQALGPSPMGLEDGNLVEESFSKGALAVDFGTTFRTGYRSLVFALTARNFSGELTYVEEGFELPLAFRVGASMDMLDLAQQIDGDTHSFVLSVDASHPRSYVEQLSFGGEYTFLNTIALRAGYTYPSDTEGMNVGAGVQSELGGVGVGFDYAFSQANVFGNVHRLAVQLGL